MLVAFSPIFVVNTKIFFVYNFVAPLRVCFTLGRISETRSAVSSGQHRFMQCVIFDLLSYCFEETKDLRQIGLVCIASSIASHQTRRHNKRISIKGYSVPRDFSWIENYKLYECKMKALIANFP